MNKKRITEKRWKEYLFVGSILFYPLLLFVVFWIGTNLNAIVLAFKTYRIDPELGKITEFAGLSNFKEFCLMVADADSLGVALKNSLVMFIVSFVFSMPLYLLFSYFLYKKCFLNRTIRAMVMIPNIVSGFVIALLFKNFIEWDGALHQLCRLMKWGSESNQYYPELFYHKDRAFPTTVIYGIWLSFATNLIVYPNMMKEIDQGILESAQIDGVDNMFTELFYIILPLLYPTLETMIITGVSAILTNAGTLYEFYELEAPNYVMNFGYFYNKYIIMNTETMFPVLSAGGLIMTAIVAPLVYGLKKFMDKHDPMGGTV